MEYAKKKTSVSSSSAHKLVTPKLTLSAAQQAAKAAEQEAHLQRQKEWQAANNLLNFTSRDNRVQRQAAQPVLSALSLYSQEVQQVEGTRPALQRQVAALQQTYSSAAVQAAIQREQERTAPTPSIRHPQSNADWVTVMRQQAEQADGRTMLTREYEQFKTLQRQVSQRLAAGYRQDRQPPALRHAQYAGHLVTLQRHPISAQVAGVVMGLIPQAERPALQRAVDEVLQREAEQQAQDAGALQLHSLQRQLAELDEQATQPVMQRIQARRGAGNPLPEAIQRHLEQGLNHDLSNVRIHDDAEADKLSKAVNAIAFTTGTDIFFRSGKFNPNTQSGLELLAHEVTHTVQQSKGNVPKGIDGDAGLEREARHMGRKLAKLPLNSGRRVYTAATQTARMTGALQRQAAKEQPAFLQTLTAGQPPKSPFAFVWQTRDGGVFIRETIGGKVLVKVPNTTRLQLLRYDPSKKAYAVRSPSGVQGWAAESHLKVPPPQLAQDAGLRFYVPKSKEGIFAVVGREYGATEFGQDARYFTNVLRAVNQPTAFMVGDLKYKGFLEAGYESVITAMTKGRDANSVQLIAGVPFWLPSPAAAKKIKAPSGSFSKQVLDTTKETFGEAGERALYGGLFMTGLQVGLLKSLWDALVGLIELVKLPITTVKAIYNVIQTALQGQLLNKVKEIYDFLVGGGLKQIANMLVGEFKAGWDNTNPLRAWEFRGQVIGYVATEIITTFIPIAGIVMKVAKAGNIVALLSSKFKWIGEAGKKAMALLDKVKIKWPPPGMSPQMAVAGGMTMGAPQQELTLGQVLRMGKTKAGNGKQVGVQTEEVAKRIRDLESKILKLEAGTPEHKAARWELNQLEGGPWTYDHWSKVYEANILKAKKSNAGVAAYQKTLGWGEVEVTVDAGGSPRRLDIADIKTQKAVEIKEYSTGYITHAEDIASEVKRDAILVSEGWDITWVFIKTKASEPLLTALKAANIKVKYE